MSGGRGGEGDWGGRGQGACRYTRNMIGCQFCRCKGSTRCEGAEKVTGEACRYTRNMFGCLCGWSGEGDGGSMSVYEEHGWVPVLSLWRGHTKWRGKHDDILGTWLGANFVVVKVMAVVEGRRWWREKHDDMLRTWLGASFVIVKVVAVVQGAEKVTGKHVVVCQLYHCESISCYEWRCGFFGGGDGFRNLSAFVYILMILSLVQLGIIDDFEP